MWQSAEGKGHVNDNVHYNQIQVDPKNINLNIGNKITADMSVKDSVAVLASQPQLAYMAKILNDPATSSKVNWSKVQEAHDQWDYKQSGLTPAAGAIVALAVAVATSGAGANAVGLMTGTSSSTALASYGVSTAAMQAAITTLASKATVSMINNQGDLGAVFNELGSSDSIKQLATAIITAGAVSALGSAIQIQGADGAMMSLDQVTAKTGGGGLVANIGKNLINGVARATITSAITNTSLEQSLQTEIVASVLNAASAAGANAVGDAASGGIDAAGNTVSPNLNEFGRALAHAVVGCMAGAAGAAANASSLSSGNGCSAGAIGAVVGELSATYFNSDLAVGEKQKVNTVEFASLMAGIAGALTGQGADAIAVAASTGGNAAANNFLNHTQAAQMKKEFEACKSKAGGCSDMDVKTISQKYLTLSKQNIDAVNSCIVKGDAACVTRLESQAATAGEVDSAIPFGYGSVANVFAGRQNNINTFASTKGSYSLFGTDVQQAQEVAQFRQDNCAGVSASACDGMVKQAQDDHLMRAGLFAAAGALTPMAVNGLKGLRMPGSVTQQERMLLAQAAKISDAKFVTKGVAFSDDMISTNKAVKSMYSDYERVFGGDAEVARDFTMRAIQSGSDIPISKQVGPNDTFVRMVPTGDGVGMSSFHVSKAQYDVFMGKGMNAAQIADALGLPASSFADGSAVGFQAYAVQPKPGQLINVYQSKIAPVEQAGYSAKGGATQYVIPELGKFSTAQAIPGGNFSPVPYSPTSQPPLTPLLIPVIVPSPKN